jgi:hypothetical protein
MEQTTTRMQLNEELKIQKDNRQAFESSIWMKNKINNSLHK